MPTEPGAANGGMMQRDEYTPSPVVTIDVEAIDTHVEEIGPAGAQQSRPGLRCQAWGIRLPRPMVELVPIAVSPSWIGRRPAGNP